MSGTGAQSRPASLMAAAVARWAESLDCAPGTAKSRASAVRQFAAWAAERGRNPADPGVPEAWQAELKAGGGLGRQTLRNYLCAARAFQNWLAETAAVQKLNADLANHRICRKALAEAPEHLLTEARCLLAVRTAGSALESVPERLRTEAVCLAAVQRTPGALRFVPEALRTAELCLEAVKRNGALLKHVPGAVLSEEICLAAAAARCALSRVPEAFRTVPVCLEAVRIDGAALAHVPGALRSRELCLEALSRGREDGWAALPFVPQALLDDAAFCTEAAGGPARCIPGELPEGLASALKPLLEKTEEPDMPDSAGSLDGGGKEDEEDEDGDEEEEEAAEILERPGLRPESFVPPVASGPPPERALSPEELKSFLEPAELEALKSVCTSLPCGLKDAFGQPLAREEARMLTERGAGPGAGLFRKGVLHWTLARAGAKKSKSGGAVEWLPRCCLTRFGLAVFSAAINDLPRRWRGARAEALALKGEASAVEADAAEGIWTETDQEALEEEILRCASRHPDMRGQLIRMGVNELITTPSAMQFWDKLLAWGGLVRSMLDEEEACRWKAWREEMPEPRQGAELATLKAAVERRMNQICREKLDAGVSEDFGIVSPRL